MREMGECCWECGGGRGRGLSRSAKGSSTARLLLLAAVPRVSASARFCCAISKLVESRFELVSVCVTVSLSVTVHNVDL